MITAIRVIKVKLYVGRDKGKINFEALKDEWCVCANPCTCAGFKNEDHFIFSEVLVVLIQAHQGKGKPLSASLLGRSI